MSLLENPGVLELQELIDEEVTYISDETNKSGIQIIAKPMANEELIKRIYKLVKKSFAKKDYLRTGLKDVQTRIRKGETGIAIFAGDVSPIDIMVHMPRVCEEKKIPYCYTPSREKLGGAMGLKRSTIMVLIREHEDYKELYDGVIKEIKSLPSPFV